LFPFIGFPHADNAAGFAAWRPNHHHHPAIHLSDRDITRLAVILANVFDAEVPTCENLARTGEIQTPFGDGFIAFFRVELDLH
jgi:hypothetical protein